MISINNVIRLAAESKTSIEVPDVDRILNGMVSHLGSWRIDEAVLRDLDDAAVVHAAFWRGHAINVLFTFRGHVYVGTAFVATVPEGLVASPYVFVGTGAPEHLGGGDAVRATLKD